MEDRAHGSRGGPIEFVAHFLGRTLRYTYEVVEYAFGAKLVMRTAQGPCPMETTYTWVAQGQASTRMSLLNRGTPSGFSAIAVPLMARAMRRANWKDLRRLKALLEAR